MVKIDGFLKNGIEWLGVPETNDLLDHNLKSRIFSRN